MHHSPRKIFHPNNQRPSLTKKSNALTNFPAEVQELYKQQKQLQLKINEIDNHLRFGYSEPLNDYKTVLMKEDMALSCQMTELLCSLSKQ